MSGATGSHRQTQSGRYRRGVGVATGYWLYLWQPGSKVEVSVKGGRLIASTATQDIGTGSRTVIANTVAREFGLEPHEIEVRHRRFQIAGRPGLGRQPHHRFGGAADAARDCEAEGRDREKRKAKAGAGLECAVARNAGGVARSHRLRRAAGGQQADGAGRRVAAEAGRHPGLDLRLDDALVLQPRDRRRRAEFGAGDRGRSRYLARPCPRPQRPHRHCGRQDRSARAGAQPGGGLGHSRHRLRALRSARDRSAAPAIR